MKKIVIIGANDFQNQLIVKAKEMGFETHVFAWADGSVGERTADYFYPISIMEVDKILEKCKEIQPDAVTTIASDLANITVSKVAKGLNLPANSLECITLSTNKYAMREAFIKAGIATPKFYKVDRVEAYLFSLGLPLIVKPTDRSGSRAITKVLDFDELNIAIKEAVDQSFEKQAIVEEFIEGDEYSYEAISYHGKHTCLAITKKYTTGSPHFIETGHKQPCDLSPKMLEQVHYVMSRALDALKITDGASHGEFKITPEKKVRIIEIGSRMGGDCIGSDLVPLSTGYDFMEMVIDVACGKAPRIEPKHAPKSAEIRFLFTMEDVEKMRTFEREHPESIYRISELDLSHAGHVMDSSTRIGYYIIVN
ncbi:MAG: ATP-grasp domain-containing protein [Lachnospiraceae bacterium]|nr:ATP-grasp domain-containing protein [Lachnospiraceae bacterium]